MRRKDEVISGKKVKTTKTKKPISYALTPEIDVSGNIVSWTVDINFSGGRYKTKISGKQGDHVTAYALYVERLITIIERHSKEEELHVSGMINEINSIPKQDDFVLKHFSLLGTDDHIDTSKLDGANIEIERSKKASEEQIKALKLAVKRLPLWATREKKTLQQLIKKIKGEHFGKVAESTATEFLKYQNSAEAVTYERASEKPTDGEGGKIKGALNALRVYRPRNNVRRQRSAAKYKEIEGILGHLETLFFYPKVDDAYAAAATTGTQRTNNPDTLCYVIVRHLITVFATFPNLANYKDDIIYKFIDNILKKWGLDDAAQVELKEKIKGGITAWENFKNASNEDKNTDKLNYSLQTDTPQKPFSLNSASMIVTPDIELPRHTSKQDDEPVSPEEIESIEAATNLEDAKEQLSSAKESEYKIRIPSGGEVLCNVEQVAADGNESISPIVPSGMSQEAFDGLEEETKQPDSARLPSTGPKTNQGGKTIEERRIDAERAHMNRMNMGRTRIEQQPSLSARTAGLTGRGFTPGVHVAAQHTTSPGATPNTKTPQQQVISTNASASDSSPNTGNKPYPNGNRRGGGGRGFGGKQGNG